MEQEKLKIPQIAIITASDTATLQDEVNAALMQHPDVTDLKVGANRAVLRFNVSIDPPAPPEIETNTFVKPDYCISFTDSLNSADSVKATIALIVPKPEKRFCAECSVYNWGRGCPYRTDLARPMDPACNLFNVSITLDGMTGERIEIEEKTTTVKQIETKEVSQ